MGRTAPSGLLFEGCNAVLLRVVEPWVVLPLLDAGGGAWMSMLHPLLVPSTSKPSLSTLILPQESQLGGIRTLSLSMTLCFKVCFFSGECMPRVECMSVGKELGEELDV